LWMNVNLDAGSATIANQRTIAGGRVVQGMPKTRAGRENDRARHWHGGRFEVMEGHPRRRALQMGAGWPDTGLVFTHPDGNGLWPQMVTARFKAIAAALELPLIGVHGLRHSAATWMIGAGVSPKLVQQRLGHADAGVTLNLNSHVMPGHDAEAAEALASAVDSARHSVIKL
jgi:integrase